MTWLSEWWSGGTAVVEPASPRDAARLAQLHGASFHRGWGEGEFEVDADRAQHARASAETWAQDHRLCGVAHGRRRGRNIVDRDRCGQRGRGLSRNLLLTHLGHLAGRGVRTVFLEVEENNQPARRLYEWAGFGVVGRRERYYQQPGGEQLNALLMRRDLS